ncbi:PSD1 and planctomycete cytochrome C domain-containing protein [Blastopirellula sp. J2-11]|uniref:PSD1 and planctomycete cytochrome C domain-containing protein n=1 Tax=Blastopirellula sp. J2-11 TaxID=2943192 RepID=UPI0021C8648C|nr:PSD1 and planctomycete cytochrome C domain-containing protein [Blastopirellula sp. J2-11]UUO09148.1 PSD1 and planctomycete cytochrome C domain-containing protein [Blastopirellula sp. J2-11]
MNKPCVPLVYLRVLIAFGALSIFVGALDAAEKSEAIDFAHQIVPILRKNCSTCHAAGKAEGGFSINDRTSFLDDGMAIPGDIDGSYFLELIVSDDPEMQMPPKDRPRVSPEEIALLRQWVAADMPWEAGFTFGDKFYEPPLLPRRPELPPVVAGRDNPIDRIIDAYLTSNQIPQPEPLADAAFLRRISLDLIGLPPTIEELQAFLADNSADKRTRAIDALLARDIDYADHWLSFWNDLLRNDYDGTGFITGGRTQITGWLYDSLRENKPFDQFTRELIAPPTAASRGFIDGIQWRGEVSAGQTTAIQFSQNVSQSLLGINMKCASCHNSFVDHWKLSNAYGLAAIYADQPLELHRCDKPTGEMAKAAWLFPELGEIDAAADQPERLRQLAKLMTAPENGRFSRTIVNRLWQRLMGRGVVHPLDSMQSRPWNEDLLDYLAVSLVDQNYDLKQVLRLIATSHAYQSQTEVITDENGDGEYVYRGPQAKRMTAEQFVDTVWRLSNAAPITMDAKVSRMENDNPESAVVELQAHWIWGDSAAAGKIPPAGETIALMRQFQLNDSIESAVAAITCDNEFQLFVNRREVAAGDVWTEVKSVALTPYLKKGPNELVVIAKNAGAGANPAGLFFQAKIDLINGESTTIASDESWNWTPAPKKAEVMKQSLSAWAKQPQPVVIVPTLAVWTSNVEDTAKISLTGRTPMVRAALLKGDFLMRALGRPNRDQVVSTRPNELTTLEAISLANGPAFDDALSRGAKKLLSHDWENPQELVNHVFLSLLSRPATDQEQAIFAEAIAEKPDAQSVQDMLWTVLMLPEFMIIR